ncbi:MAG: 2TM domain-containing protein [Bacteroidales bacterium]|nr:2TM domain-containing protein [Bacteroidales bacterium]
MEENETIPTTNQEKTTIPDVNVEEEAKMQNVATSRMRFRIHLGLFILINLIIWVLYFTLFNAIVTDFSIKWAILKVFICITVAWFLLLVLHYCIAFKWNKTLVEKELARIKKQRNKQLKTIEKLKAQIQNDKVKEEQPQN